MNSRILKKEFPNEYKKFFSRCEMVVSAPHSFLWTGDFSGFYGGLTLLSKLPIRVYVGIEKISEGLFEVERELIAYHPVKKCFAKTILDDYLIEELSKNLSGRMKGYRLVFFSEIVLGLSLGGLGAMSAGISALLYKNPSDRQKFAGNLVTKLQQGRSSPATAFASLCESEYPVVFYSDNQTIWGRSLDEIAELPSNAAIPFDYGLIFSGNLVQGSAVIRSAEGLVKSVSHRENIINKLIGKKTKKFWPTYLAMLEQVSYATLYAMIDVLKNGAKEETVTELFDSMNQYQNLLHFLDITTPNIDKIYSQVHRVANKNENRLGSGCKISGVGKGGEILFALPYGCYREKIEQEVEKISQDVELNYSSWLDKTERSGVILEQDLKNNLPSDFVKKGMSKVEFFSGENMSVRLIDCDCYPQADLVIDTLKNKIFIKGHPVDSKKLPSQRATVEILSNLFKNNFKLDNSKLKKSYGKSRYDLQSKITIPLEKFAGLKFEISGGAYDGYNLQLKPFDISVAIISKIN